MNKPEEVRRRWRAAVVEGRSLVDLLNEEQRGRRLALNATDREVGRWIAQQELVDRLNKLLEEASATDRNLLEG